MDLLIFSDSHGNADAMQRAIDRSVSRPDAIFSSETAYGISLGSIRAEHLSTP